MIRVFIILTALFIYATAKSQSASNTDIDSSQQKTPQAKLYPNIVRKAIMTPTGWGSKGTFIFGSIGGTFPQTYSNLPDLIASVGIGTGNASKNVSLIAILNVNDVSELDNYSASFLASRYIGIANSIGAGALHLFADPKKTDSGPSYFVTFTHTVQTVPSKTPNFSGLSYTIGVGSGRFSKKSEKDILEGRGSGGTGVFGSISYEVFKNVNAIVEWTGVNLGFTVGARPWLKLPSICFGLADITRLSGDKPRFVVGFGQAFYLSK